ncbi:hypothetical protein BGW36DRAFT_431446 [Talaromyces proteolyticus]|uniref:Uncharacterized protein n=1 Tax=Talaromyces proteolyticus TaxID=1131652 RepID=A0AAD4KLZ0_9EURO|nr:uncharacterized protein BGW36DRAFT_431446 [Talaromyces proteolyticus]KAH8692226.1 hypothetical protein BGW36DRAFT_431446 [Talaromyces proteolyticus]
MPITRSQARIMKNPQAGGGSLTSDIRNSPVYSMIEQALSQNSSAFLEQDVTTQDETFKESLSLDVTGARRQKPPSGNLFTTLFNPTASAQQQQPQNGNPETLLFRNAVTSSKPERKLSFWPGSYDDDDDCIGALPPFCRPPRTAFGINLNGPPPPPTFRSQPQGQINQEEESTTSLVPANQSIDSCPLEKSEGERILDSIKCLDDLTENTLRGLIANCHGLVTITAFKVTLIEWGEWSDPLRLKGYPIELNWDGWEYITVKCGSLSLIKPPNWAKGFLPTNNKGGPGLFPSLFPPDKKHPF